MLIDKSWPSCPEICKDANELLKELHRKSLVKCYLSKMTPKRMILFEEKVKAENLFKFKKENYSSLVSRPFEQFRINENELKNFEKIIKQFDEKVVYAAHVTKIDR